MSLLAHSHRRAVAAFALLVGCALLPSGAPPFAGTPAAAQTAPSGTAAEVTSALAELQRIGGIIQNFPLAPRYYDVAPCHPVAASELALLNSWNAQFQSAAAKFDAAVNAYAATWRTRTGAAGRAELAGATPPAGYQRQGQQLKSRTAQAHQAKAAAIKARIRVCPVHGGDGPPPVGWGGTSTTTAPPMQTPQQAPTPPAANPPTQAPPIAPSQDVNPESLGLVWPEFKSRYMPTVPECYPNERERQADLDFLRLAHANAVANSQAASEFVQRIGAAIASFDAKAQPVPPSLLQLQASARRVARNYAEDADVLFARMEEARRRPLCPPSEGGGVGTVPSGTGTVPARPSEQQPPSGDTPDERQSRLDAIDRLRTGDANRSGTEVAPALPGTRDPSHEVREDVQDRTDDAARERKRKAAAHSLQQEPGGQPTKPGTPPAANPPPTENVPPPEELPPGTAQPPSETQISGPGASNQAPTETQPPGKRPPRSRTGPRRPGPPVEPLPPVLEPQPKEDILEDLDEVGAAGDLAYENPLLDQLTVEFNKAVRECDLKAFLEVRERYVAELRRILSNPNLNARARQHFERILKAVLETTVPIRAPLPCPVLIR
jgi:hypothetical protein